MPDSFVLLVSTILESLDPSEAASDALLLRLHALFGPMLTSALQLIDKREVVRITLPGGRSVWQVTGSTGLPYTIHSHFESLPRLARSTEDDDSSEADRPSSPTPSTSTDQMDLPSTPSAQVSAAIRREAIDADERAKQQEAAKAALARKQDKEKHERIARMALMLERMYCPCVGFMFNSMTGNKNYLCKHLLAVVLAHYTDKAVRTQVRFDGVVDLLGLRTPAAALAA